MILKWSWNWYKIVSKWKQHPWLLNVFEKSKLKKSNRLSESVLTHERFSPLIGLPRNQSTIKIPPLVRRGKTWDFHQPTRQMESVFPRKIREEREKKKVWKRYFPEPSSDFSTLFPSSRGTHFLPNGGRRFAAKLWRTVKCWGERGTENVLLTVEIGAQIRIAGENKKK